MQTNKSGVVSIIGRPNAGKSTLLNSILKTEISIVTPKAQTTRQQIRGIYTVDDLGQILFLDTPGIHRAKKGGINELMMNDVSLSLEDPDIVWYLVDPDSALKHEEEILKILEKIKIKSLLIIINKSDLKREKAQAFASELMEAIQSRAQVLKIDQFQLSARYGENVTKLLERTWDLLPEGPNLFGDSESLSDKPVRFFVSEMIRKQLYLQLGEELPYSCAIEIKEYRETKKLIYIKATIYVERESQKPMLIGRGGQKIKAIGSEARKGVEKFVGEKVFLDLNVQVLLNWSKDMKNLKKLGFNVPK